MTEIITGATATVTIVVRDSSDATLAKANSTPERTVMTDWEVKRALA